jgi:hypothetical protein
MTERKSRWWDAPAADPCSLLIQRYRKICDAAKSVGVNRQAIYYWRSRAIPRKKWAAFEAQGISLSQLEDHNKKYKKASIMGPDYHRLYYIANKEKIKEYYRLYYIANKERMKKYRRLYYIANRERIKAYYRAHYRKNHPK